MRRPGPPELAITAGALVLLATAVGTFPGDEDGDMAAATGEATVAIVDFTFEPSPIQAAVGAPVRWSNGDSAAHTVTSDDDGQLDSGELAEGDSYEATFDAAGTYSYVCELHPSMKGTVEVSS